MSCFRFIEAKEPSACRYHPSDHRHPLIITNKNCFATPTASKLVISLYQYHHYLVPLLFFLFSLSRFKQYFMANSQSFMCFIFLWICHVRLRYKKGKPRPEFSACHLWREVNRTRWDAMVISQRCVGTFKSQATASPGAPIEN